MSRNLQSRIERLQAVVMPARDAPWHRVTQRIGESEQQARRRYERESGRSIAPDDNVVLRVICQPAVPA